MEEIKKVAVYVRQGKPNKQEANHESEQARKDLRRQAFKSMTRPQGKRVYWFF